MPIKSKNRRKRMGGNNYQLSDVDIVKIKLLGLEHAFPSIQRPDNYSNSSMCMRRGVLSNNPDVVNNQYLSPYGQVYCCRPKGHDGPCVAYADYNDPIGVME